MFETIFILYLIVTIILFVGDFLTGTIRSAKRKELTSKAGKKGFFFFIGTLAGYLLLEAVGFTIDVAIFRVIGHCPSITAQFILVTMLFLYYVYIQLLSIAENLMQLGYPVPKIFKRYLKTNNDDDRADDLINIVKKLTENKDKIDEIIKILKK